MSGVELVKKAEDYINQRTQSVVAEHQKLRETIQDNVDPDLNGEAAVTKLQQRLVTNLNALENFYDVLQSSETNLATDTINYNPINYIFRASHDYLDDEVLGAKIINGTYIPRGYEDQHIPVIGQEPFWGSTHCSIYSNLLTLQAKDPQQAIGMRENSSIFHVTPLKPNLAEALQGYEYLHNTNGFGYVHTGYVYDGDRHDDSMYPVVKKFAPKDCSQFVQEILGHKNRFRTRDMLFTFRTYDKTGYIKEDWANTARAKELCSKVIPVAIEDVQPGDVHVTMDFHDDEKPNLTKVHGHGHTTIVHSKQGSDVLTLGVGQAPYPRRDGFGFETYTMHPSVKIAKGTTRETRFLRAIT